MLSRQSGLLHMPTVGVVRSQQVRLHAFGAPSMDSRSRWVTQPGAACLGGSMSTQHDLMRALHPQRAVLLHAQRQRRPLEDDVELDDGDSFGAQGFSIGPALRQAWAALAGVTDCLSDTIYNYVPEGVSRSTVTLATRTGLLLVLIGFARSILGFVLTIGTVVLGLFVASRVLGIEAGGGRGQRPGSKRGGRRDGKWDSGGSREMPRSRFDRPPRRLPSGVAKESDVLDVWFETKDAEEERRRPR